MAVTVTNHGTAGGNMLATFPVAPVAAVYNVGISRESAVAGVGGFALILPSDLTHLYLFQFNNATYWVDSYVVVANVTYEAA
jgi:hypothetical protein